MAVWFQRLLVLLPRAHLQVSSLEVDGFHTPPLFLMKVVWQP